MSTGAKDIHRLRDWDDDDYSEGFSEYLSEQGDSVGDVLRYSDMPHLQ